MKNAILFFMLAALSVPAPATGKRTDLDGVWILLRAEVGKLQLTPEGERKRAAYDFQKDDPDFQCKPASITRVMHTPSPPIEVRQHLLEDLDVGPHAAHPSGTTDGCQARRRRWPSVQ